MPFGPRNAKPGAGGSGGQPGVARVPNLKGLGLAEHLGDARSVSLASQVASRSNPKDVVAIGAADQDVVRRVEREREVVRGLQQFALVRHLFDLHRGWLLLCADLPRDQCSKYGKVACHKYCVATATASAGTSREYLRANH